MTYRDLLNQLKDLPQERLDDDVTVYLALSEETIPVNSSFTVSNSDPQAGILDEGHFVLQVDF